MAQPENHKAACILIDPIDLFQGERRYQMTNSIKSLEAVELQLVCGGVTEDPEGKSCTEHDLPVDLGPVRPTIEIDTSI